MHEASLPFKEKKNHKAAKKYYLATQEVITYQTRAATSL
jgi:hypothetical protein